MWNRYRLFFSSYKTVEITHIQSMSAKIPSLIEMLQAGVHFGHQKSKWYPKMDEYLFSERKGVHIINLEITQKKLVEALNFVTELVANKGTIILVGTKKQAS